MARRVKGAARKMRAGPAVWAGPDTLTIPRGAPLVVCADLDDLALAEAAVLPATRFDLRDAERYPADGRRARFLQRRSILRTLCARVLGRPAADIACAHDADGAPRLMLPEAALHVSVSGRGALAAFALSTRRVGVDLEPVGPPLPPAWNILHGSEQAWIDGLAPDARHAAFLKIWTVKEAYLKMLGLGLRIEPAEVAVAVATDGAARIAAGGPGRPAAWGEWRLSPLGGETVAAAVVYE